jgi:hypothetical protein
MENPIIENGMCMARFTFRIGVFIFVLGCFRKICCFKKCLDLMLKIAVDSHERLRFPRGDCGASSATPAGSPQTAISRRSLRLSLQSTARICMIQYEFLSKPIKTNLKTNLEWIVAEGT